MCTLETLSIPFFKKKRYQSVISCPEFKLKLSKVLKLRNHQKAKD